MPEDGAQRSRRPPQWLLGLHLGGLWAVAVVQPLFDLLGGSAEFFPARGNTAGDILILAFAVTIVPPLVLFALQRLAALVSRGLGWAVQVLLVAILGGLIALQAIGDALGAAMPALVVSVAVAVLVGWLYARVAAARTFVSIASVAPVAFLALFLFASPVSALVFGDADADEVKGLARSDTPVVFITFDEFPATTLMLPDGHIDAKHFPNFARLAAGSTWYRNATTVADSTTFAVPALLSGTRASADALPTLADHPRNLFTLLRRTHRIDATEPATALCPPASCGEDRAPAGSRLRSLVSDLGVVSLRQMLPAQLASGLPAVDKGWGGFADQADAPGRATDADNDPARIVPSFVGRLGERSARPALRFLHVLLPHVPWRFTSAGQYTVPGDPYPGLTDERWTGERWEVEQAYQRQLAQTQYADRQLGAILRKLRATGQYADAAIVVMADHGSSFRPGDERRAVTAATFADIANVPLFVKAPGQRRGAVDDDAVRSVDALPTLARAMGATLPWPVDGIDADRRDADPDQRLTIFAADGRSPVTSTFGAFLRRRDEAVRAAARLTAGRAWAFGIGPRPALVGRRRAALPASPPVAGHRATLDDPEQYATTPSRGSAPTWVSGRTQGLAVGTELAISVNGRVAATTRTRSERGATVFAALVDPAGLRPEGNDVRVGRIVAGRRLEPLTGTRVVRLGDGALTVGDRSLALRSRPRTGALDGVVRQPTVLQIAGWAGRRDLGAPAEAVAAFAGDRLVAFLRPSGARLDLAGWRRGLRNAGFVLDVPLSELRRAKGQLRVFALDGTVATELPALGAVPAALRALG